MAICPSWPALRPLPVSARRWLMGGAMVALSLWAFYVAYLAYESQRDVRDLHHEVQNEVNMDENSASLKMMSREYPDAWRKEHPRSYESLIWMMERHGMMTAPQARIYVAFDESCAPDYRILVAYTIGKQEPVLTNARLEILGVR